MRRTHDLWRTHEGGRGSGGAGTRRRMLAAAGTLGVSGAPALVGLAACGAPSGGAGAGGAPPGPQTLGPATLDVITRDEPIERGLMERLYARFAEQHPRVTVQPVSPGANFNDKVAALLAGGTPPAVTGPWGTGGYRFWAVKGALAELDALIARDKYDLADFYPKFVEATRMGGKRYALPMGVGIQVLAYNREAFQRAGQAPPPGWSDRAWTWDRFLTTARALTRDPDGPGAQWGTGTPWGDDRRVAYLYGGAWFDLKAYETGRARPTPGSASSSAAPPTSSGPSSSSSPAGSRCASFPCSPRSSRPARRSPASSRSITSIWAS